MSVWNHIVALVVLGRHIINYYLANFKDIPKHHSSILSYNHLSGHHNGMDRKVRRVAKHADVIINALFTSSLNDLLILSYVDLRP
jgi:hypothetical protein